MVQSLIESFFMVKDNLNAGNGEADIVSAVLHNNFLIKPDDNADHRPYA